MFTFGHSIGIGSENDNFQCGFTSVKLLQRIEQFNNNGVYHLDATYKIIKHCFPLIVFGFSDIARQFYPVAFMITSHEKTTNYKFFFKSLIAACQRIHVVLKPAYICIDACSAMARSINWMFPDCTILMCWFHLKQNLRKHKQKIPAHLYNQTMDDVNSLHKATCSGSYKVKTSLFI